MPSQTLKALCLPSLMKTRPGFFLPAALRCSAFLSEVPTTGPPISGHPPSPPGAQFHPPGAQLHLSFDTQLHLPGAKLYPPATQLHPPGAQATHTWCPTLPI